MKMIPGCCDVPLAIRQSQEERCVCHCDLRDGMRLPAAGSAICKDCRIVSIQYTVQKWLRRSFVHIPLRGGIVEYAIKCKCLVLCSLSLGPNS